jgi:spermidine/putrescine-binding protein
MKMKIKKKDLQKMENSAITQWDKLKQEYDAGMKGIRVMSDSSLILLCIVGITIVVYFSKSLLVIIGLLVFAYALYVFASREGHRDGYCEGHYNGESVGNELQKPTLSEKSPEIKNDLENSDK